MDLPPLYLIFTWRAGMEPLLVSREPGGAVGEAGPVVSEPLPGALVVYGPGPRPWDHACLEFFSAARHSGGAVFPLSRILDRLRPVGGGPRDPLGHLGSRLEDVEDPARFARELLLRLGDVLQDSDGGTAPPGEATVVPGGAIHVEEPEGEGLSAPVRITIDGAPESPGVYVFLDRSGEPLYVGKARSLRRRLRDHLRKGEGQALKREGLVRDASAVRWEIAGSELEALLLEQVCLGTKPPPLNRQRRAHRRRRGAWRDRRVALILPSAETGWSELCLVCGEGRLHWERVLREARVARGTWTRVAGFLRGSFPGWAPGRPGVPLTPAEAGELAEIALTWLATREPGATRLDLAGDTGSPDLKRRLRVALAADPGSERVEFR